MYYYLAHQIEHISLKEVYDEDTFDRYFNTTSNKMVEDEKRLKVISSETPIELGEEITENHNEFGDINDFYWEERWIIIQELSNINFWRM